MEGLIIRYRNQFHHDKYHFPISFHPSTMAKCYDQIYSNCILSRPHTVVPALYKKQTKNHFKSYSVEFKIEQKESSNSEHCNKWMDILIPLKITYVSSQQRFTSSFSYLPNDYKTKCQVIRCIFEWVYSACDMYRKANRSVSSLLYQRAKSQPTDVIT